MNKTESSDSILSLVREIERNVPINDVIQDYAGEGVADYAYGTRYVSPFVENDDGRSLFVHNNRKTWKCFKSGKGGNVIDFLVQAKELESFIDGRTPDAESYAFAIDQILEKHGDDLNQIKV
jgi:DNA primase